MSFSSFTRYFFITSLLSLFTVVYLGKTFPEDTLLFKDGPQGRSLFPANIDPSSLEGSPSFKYLDLNILSAALFKFAEGSTLLNQQRVAALVFINAGFLILYLLGTFTVKLFFDEIREIEYQHMYDRVLNFLLFKVVFLGAILEPKWNDMFLWVSWLAVIGYLRVFSMLCRDRCEFIYDSSSEHPGAKHKLLAFLILIILADIFWFTVCLFSFRSMLFLLTFECFTLLLDTTQTLVKYVIHLQDTSAEIWESKDLYLRKAEFFTDAAILVATLIHYLQIAFIHGISFTLIDAVLFLNIRSVFKSLRRKFLIYKSYRSAIVHLKNRFPCATEEELAKFGSACPICLEDMTVAQKLPCNHIFHARCLGLWLENHPSCPTCRKELNKADGCDSLLRPSTLAPERRVFANTGNLSPSGATGLHPTPVSPPASSGVEWDRGLGVVNNLLY